VTIILYLMKNIYASEVSDIIMLNIQDAHVLKMNNVYYMTTESSLDSSSIPLYESTDLKSWKFVKFLFTKENIGEWIHGTKLLGPNIYYVENSYNIYYYCLNKAEKWTIGVATGPNHDGPFVDLGHSLLEDSSTNIYGPSVVQDGKLNRLKSSKKLIFEDIKQYNYTLSEARSGVDWADLMAAQGAFGTGFYDRSTVLVVVGTML